MALTLLATLGATVPANAGRPGALADAQVTHHATDCSVTFEARLATRGRAAVAVVAHYRQVGSGQGASYAYFTGLRRGQELVATMTMPADDPALGSWYEVGYTAFARNGAVLETATTATLDNSGCL